MPVKKLHYIDKVLNDIIYNQLFEYQRKWILDNSQYKICCKSRQIGMSFTVALEGLIDVMRGEPVYFVSRSERQSVHLLDKFYTWADYFSAAGVSIPFTARTKTDCKINGVDVKSLTSNAVTGEGFTGNLILDEFALHQEDEQLYKSLFPITTQGYKLRIISRPYGQSNMFHRIFNSEHKYKGFSRHLIDVHQAIKDGLKINLDSIRENFDEEGFRENFLCEFLDEKTSYFPYSIITKAIAEIPKVVNGEKFIGIDIGRTNDLTSIMVLTKTEDDIFYLTHQEVLKNCTFVEQKQVISTILECEKPKRVYIDKGGIGYQLGEDLEREYSFVKGVHFNPTFKTQIVTNLKKVLEQERIKISDDQDLIDQIHSVKKTVSKNNTIGFDAERTSKGHSDSAFA
ncbi:MAG: hypothetical protein EHM58_19405, partial [Ignavibacteriae bacterium]